MKSATIKLMPFSKKRHFFAYFKPGTNTGGFSLIETVLSMFVILAIISVLFTVSATYKTSRKSNLQGVATEIAARQIETLRNTAYDSLPGSGSFNDSSLSKLPSGTANQTITAYQSSTDVKQVAIQIMWTEGGIQKTLNMDTLIYRNGI